MIPIVLASTSASRAALLKAAGVAFTAMVSGVDEDEIKTRMRAAAVGADRIALSLAEGKAVAVSRRTSGLVIGGDQTLELDGVHYGKSCVPEDTRATLLGLRGRRHSLHSGVALARDGTLLWSTVVSSALTMRWFSDTFLDGYLERCGAAVASSVGAYHLEGEGAQLFESIDGDYFAILGLPMLALLGALRRAGGLPK